jgi:hypothetical protein
MTMISRNPRQIVGFAVDKSKASEFNTRHGRPRSSGGELGRVDTKEVEMV